jgi:hypothetical protein
VAALDEQSNLGGQGTIIKTASPWPWALPHTPSAALTYVAAVFSCRTPDRRRKEEAAGVPAAPLDKAGSTVPSNKTGPAMTVKDAQVSTAVFSIVAVRVGPH